MEVVIEPNPKANGYIVTVGKATLPGIFTSPKYAEQAANRYIASHKATLSDSKYSRKKSK